MTGRLVIAIACAALSAFSARAGTLATLRTSVGTVELELFDEDKPVTVSNFIAYVQSGRWDNLIVQRWVTNFVIQAGGYIVGTNGTGGQILHTVPVFGEITNEYSSGRTFSNTYGTIAMARRGGATNSATSQWFLNVADNKFLDAVDGGFTVFGRTTAGTNVLNLFVPPAGTRGLWQVNIDGGALATVPVLTNKNVGYDDLVYVEISLRRDVGLQIARGRDGRTLTWTSIPGMSNIVEFSPGLAGTNWQTLSAVPGTGSLVGVTDSAPDSTRFYRVKLMF